EPRPEGGLLDDEQESRRGQDQGDDHAVPARALALPTGQILREGGDEHELEQLRRLKGYRAETEPPPGALGRAPEREDRQEGEEPHAVGGVGPARQGMVVDREDDEGRSAADPEPEELAETEPRHQARHGHEAEGEEDGGEAEEYPIEVEE